MPFKRYRYTPKRLQADIDEINAAMPEGSRKLVFAPAYEWQGINEYEGNKCLRQIKLGTSRECFDAACIWEANERLRLIELQGKK